MDTKNMRLMRYKDACEALGLGRNKVRELARQAKAMYTWKKTRCTRSQANPSP